MTDEFWHPKKSKSNLGFEKYSTVMNCCEEKFEKCVLNVA